MKVKNIIFWQQEPSLHQAPYIKKIDSQYKDLQVYAIFQRPLRQERINQGWGNACFGGANIIIGPSEEEIYELIFTLQNVVHIFSGIVSNKNIRKLFEKCLKTNAIIGLLSEGRYWRGGK